MKFNVFQRAFAKNWPLKIVLYGGPIGMAVWAWIALSGRFEPSIWSAFCIAGVVFAAALMGIIMALLVAPILLKPMYRWQGRRNGAPYRIGDEVRIIGGIHCNRVGRVSAIYEEQLQVCVRLVEPLPQEKDVFSYVQIRRLNH